MQNSIFPENLQSYSIYKKIPKMSTNRTPNFLLASLTAGRSRIHFPENIFRDIKFFQTVFYQKNNCQPTFSTEIQVNTGKGMRLNTYENIQLEIFFVSFTKFTPRCYRSICGNPICRDEWIRQNNICDVELMYLDVTNSIDKYSVTTTN